MAQPTVSDAADAGDIQRAKATKARRARLEALTFDDLSLDEAARARVEQFRDAVLAATDQRPAAPADLWSLEGPAEAAPTPRAGEGEGRA